MKTLIFRVDNLASLTDLAVRVLGKIACPESGLISMAGRPKRVCERGISGLEEHNAWEMV
jgi:hypothetical protein